MILKVYCITASYHFKVKQCFYEFNDNKLLIERVLNRFTINDNDMVHL